MIIENANVIILTDMMAINWARTVGAFRIATELRKNGFTCQVIDAVSSLEDEIEDLLSRVVGKDTLMLGISSTFISDQNGDIYSRWGLPFGKQKMDAIFSLVKTINPKIKIVFGGYKAHYQNEMVDARMLGHSDVAIVEYAKFLQGKNPFFQYTIDPLGKMVINGDTMNAGFDFQSSQIIYAPEDNIVHGEKLVVETARGCIFKCKFCSWKLNGKTKNDHIKHAEVLREELLRNYLEHGVTRYYVSDDTFNDSSEKLRIFAEMADTLPFKLKLDVYLRIDLMRRFPEQYDYLKRIGMGTVRFGIETLNYEALKLIGKGMNPDRVVEELHKFKREMPDVRSIGSFIIGLPLETKETINAWVEQLNDPDFPLDVIKFNPMAVNIYADKQDKSVFEEESEKYFKFDDKGFWYNDHFSRQWCIDFVDRITEERFTKCMNIECLGINSKASYERAQVLIKKFLSDEVQNNQIEREFVEAAQTNKQKYINALLDRT